MDNIATTTGTAQPYAFDLQSSVSGDWNLMIDKNLSPGPHVIMAEDEYGNTDEALIYILKQTETPTGTSAAGGEFGLIDRVTAAAPAISIIVIWFLVILVAIAALNMLRLAKNADIEAAASIPRRTKYFRLNIIVAAVLVGLALFAGIFFIYKLGYFKITKVAPEMILDKVSGQVIDPLTLQGVKVDLSSGDTMVKTSGSGYFVFSRMNAGEGIRLTHPDLKRAVVLLPDTGHDEQVISWIFNLEMYNVLIDTLDAEARGKFGDIYKNLPAEARNKIDSAQFTGDYKTILTPVNTEDQTVVIKNISMIDQWGDNRYQLLFDKVYAFDVLANKKTDTFYLVNEAGEWKILK